ncbi:MAG: MFS transporter, partial [Xanthobacteraceae bacterium]
SSAEIKSAEATSMETIDVAGWINSRQVSALQIVVLILCAAAAALEGFDTQNIGYVAPAIIREWHSPPHDFTIVFVSGLIGLLIGCLVVAPLADWFGRRRVLIGTATMFGILSLATVSAHSVLSLCIFRFFTDLALAGGMANAIAMTSEYFPARMRAWMTVVMFCGFPLGASLGGFVAAAIIPSYGWRLVFVIGGILPLILATCLATFLPESIRHLVVSGADVAKISAILHRIDPRSEFPAHARFVMAADQPLAGLTVKHLFTEQRALGTVLIWIVFFMSLLDIFLLTSWLPEVLHDAGFSISASAIATAALQGSGVIGSLAIGPLLDRRGCLTALLPMYVLAAAGIAGIGSAGVAFPLILLASCGAGVGVVTGQNTANAFAAIFYPTSIRATGVGWALGIGRFGAIVGPIIGGIMLGLHFSRPMIFGIGAIPSVIAALAVFGLMRLERAKRIAPPPAGKPLSAH